MPWTCPACSSQIRHNELNPVPRPNTIYRCHICRLELILDPKAGKMVVAPMPDDGGKSKRGK
jgi:hypothetical protein